MSKKRHNAQGDSEFALPEALQRQLAEFEKRLLRTETFVAICGGATALAMAFGIVFVSDRFWDTSAWVRVLIALSSTVSLLAFFWMWFKAWVIKRRDTRDLARLVQRKYRRMGDRLLGAVELAAPVSDAAQIMSSALRRAAIQQVSREAAEYSFKDAVDTRRSNHFKLALAGLGIVLITASVLYPEAGRNAFRRCLQPLSAVPRYTFVNVGGFPDSLIVPHGEDFTVSGRVDPASKWIPDHAIAEFDGQPEVLAPIRAHEVTFDIPGQTDAGRLQIHIGDYKDGVNVVPVLRPELQALIAAVHPPDYLHHPDVTNTLQTPYLQVVEGSRVRLDARVSRGLSEAHALSTNAVEVLRSGATLTTADVTVDAPQTITLSWTDTYGLSGERPYTVNIGTVADEAPYVECRGSSRAIAILGDDVFDFTLTAQDDFGVKKLWVGWKTISGELKDKPEGEGQVDIQEGGYTRTRASGTFAFSPLAAHIPEESVISLAAYASDYYPGRTPSVSPEILIYVLSNAQHADRVMKAMEDVHAQVEEITRVEEELLDDNRALDSKPPEELSNPESREKLRENEATERRQSERLEDLARQTQKLVDEAMRNTDISESTIAEWAELNEAMKDVAKQDMQKAAESLQKAGDQQEQRKEELKKAIAKEEEAVKKLQDAAKEMDKSLEEMMAESFVNRLRQAADREGQVASELEALLPKTIGLDAASIPAEVAETFDAVTDRQTDTHKQVGYIQDDLAGFYSRTRMEKYNEVYLEMRSTEVVDALERLGNLIRDNIAIQAIADAKKWSAQLSVWAEALTPPKKEGGGEGSGDAPEGLEPEDMEVLIALMRTRKLEEGLRRHTRMLEEGREENRRYIYDARKLGRKQDKLASDTRPIERRVKNPKLRQLIEKIGGEMMNAAMLLQAPQTGRETIAIETEIIELLSNSIDSASDSQSSSSASQKLAQMMQEEARKQGQQPGKKPGRGEGGGSGEGPANGEGTGRTQQGSAERNVERASGMSRETPQEFRDVLEAYFQALEDKP